LVFYLLADLISFQALSVVCHGPLPSKRFIEHG
jgi:hypothetical protein